MANQRNGFRGQLRIFVQTHRGGWNHHDWLELLAELTDAGVDTSDPDRIGAALEHERILAVLESMDVKGLGPKRREALADRFGRLHDLRAASTEEIAELPSFHLGLAAAVHDAMS
jgi:NAD-dependent DNA ligase